MSSSTRSLTISSKVARTVRPRCRAAVRLTGPQRYTVGYRNRAIVVIADRSWHPTLSGGPQCDALGSGFFHLCFPASPTPGFLVEATDDFRHWETIHEAAPIDNALHFVDPILPAFHVASIV
jgi:hypothetical protein